jgi:hypothetical protein
MADRIIEAMERDKLNPPKPRTRKIKWGDSKEIAEAWWRQNNDAK